MNSKLILASGSPRRKELLSLYTTDFEIHVSDFDESAVTADTPARLVEKLARGKCLAVAARHPGDLVLGCDTVVDVNGLDRIEGDYYTIMGLPVSRTVRLIEQF